MDGIANEASELHREWGVQTEVAPKRVALLLRRVLPQQIGDGITHILKQHEGNESHREHHDDGLRKAAENEN